MHGVIPTEGGVIRYDPKKCDRPFTVLGRFRDAKATHPRPLAFRCLYEDGFSGTELRNCYIWSTAVIAVIRPVSLETSVEELSTFPTRVLPARETRHTFLITH